ncbi:hypothetical protein [Desulfatiglans anilini]|uniref:hypothetical protein n=1 Tax=Desulfatiglans anilini TaxID=90728 RepID=UPI00048148BA|nr:hypothetical protein [Desulfatiglans anilini]
MKKVLLGVMALAIAFVLAVPAMAEVKLTTTGYMDVRGIMVKENIVNDPTFEAESTNAYYKQKMVIDPVLHINDKIRIHGRVTIMERFWEGSMGTGLGDDITKTDDRVNYRAKNNNFWWERLYLSFPLLGGHLYVGRQSGGAWGTWFQDWDSNRDRVKWVGKLPNSNIVLAAGLEKLNEGDGGFVGANYRSLTLNPVPNDVWTKSYDDINAYFLGSVIPFSKSFVYKPLLYYIQFQSLEGYDFLFANQLTYTSGPFMVDAEINWRKRDWDVTGREGSQISGWVEGTYAMGPFTMGLGLFYLQGEDAVSGTDNDSIWSVGPEFQPYFLFFSEDVGLLWDTLGVPNGSVGASGYESIYVKGSYKISETMKLTGVLGYLQASEMEWAGVDDYLGMEFDLNFEWKLMDNLKYVVDLAYLKAGDYFEDVTTGAFGRDLTNDPYGMRHMLVIQW